MTSMQMRDLPYTSFTAASFVVAGEPAPNPDVAQSTHLGTFRVLNLDALVRIKRTAFRDKARTHVRDLIGVGTLDQSWSAKLPPVLAQRLQPLLDTPEV